MFAGSFSSSRPFISAGNVREMVCVCIDAKVCSSVCVCTFLYTTVPVLPMCANECEAGDYARVSKGTGVGSQELQCLI